MSRKRYFIDLFAGCGGLSLGLELAGFVPLVFSEINKDAAATYTANRKEQNLTNYPDISQLNTSELKKLKNIWKNKGIYDIDLVCGGPPCQGYSRIGHRRTFKIDKCKIPSNFLFREMIRVIKLVEPKMFLFENVKGLLDAKWSKNGTRGEIFRDILGEMSTIPRYDVRWQLIHAKDYGVPQNRPRVLIVGIRKDLVYPLPFAEFEKKGEIKQSAIKDGLLPSKKHKPPNLEDIIGDLVDPTYMQKKIDATSCYKCDPVNLFQEMLRTLPNGQIQKIGSEVTEQEYSRHSKRIHNKFQSMIENGGQIPEQYRTKKFAQRVIARQ